MTRRIVYGISLWVFLGAVACTIAAIALPNWISLTTPTDSEPVAVHYGLHKRCSSLDDGACTPFPGKDDCGKDTSDGRYFCSMWKSTGFFMNFSVVFELACLVAYVTVLAGGRTARENGWKMLSGLLAVTAASQLIAMALVAYVFDHDNRFFPGWYLDKSWVLCTVSWTVLAFDAVAVVAAAYLLPSEDDYEPIQ